MNSYEEIAEMTGLSKTSIGNRLTRMRERLKEIMERKGLDYEG
jgi:DNA-directed RNA polymerase specialized sigma24 family protein